MSLCVAHGHHEAYLYPIGFAMDEANFIRERESGRIVTEAELIRTGIASLISKGSRKQFSKLTKTLNVVVEPSPQFFGTTPGLTEAQKAGPSKKKSLADAVLPKGVPKPPPDG